MPRRSQRGWGAGVTEVDEFLNVDADRPMGDEGLDDTAVRTWLVDNTDGMTRAERVELAEQYGWDDIVEVLRYPRPTERVVVAQPPVDVSREERETWAKALIASMRPAPSADVDNPPRSTD